MNTKEPELEENIDPSSDELYERLSIIVDKGQEPLRIDKFLLHKVVNTSRNKIQTAIDSGMVLVNEKKIKSNYKVRPSDQIIFYSDNDPVTYEIIPEEIPLNIVFEDEHILIINKPAGMVVHPGSGNFSGTLINGVAFHLKKQNPSLDENKLPRFGMVHRIDKNTSGLIVLAKNVNKSNNLVNQIFDDLEGYRNFCRLYGYKFDEADLYKDRVFSYSIVCLFVGIKLFC